MQNDILYQFLIIDSYLQDGDLNQANVETNKLANLASNSPAHLRKEILDFVKLKRWMLTALQNSYTIANLDLASLTFLRDMATNGDGTAQYQAQNILCFFYDECNFYSFYPEDNSPRMQVLQQEITSDETLPQFNIYPNPASTWVMIELTENDFNSLGNVEIIITDITGKIVHQTNLTRTTYLWETGNIENGVYLIVIKSADVAFKTEKIIINN